MTRSQRLVSALAICGALSLSATNRIQAAEFEPSEELQIRVNKVAKEVLAELKKGSGNPGDKIEGQIMHLITETVLQAVVPVDVENIRSAEANLGETARTDRKIGSGGSSAASTTLVQNAGIPRLLALAIENGAIRQESRGTNIVLSTSPYAVAALMNGGDTQSNFDNYSVLRRLGVSATFDISETDARTAHDFDTKNVSELGARIRILGDRSTRSSGFLKLWNEKERPKIQQYLNSFSAVADNILDGEASLDLLTEGGTKHGILADSMLLNINAYWKAAAGADDEIALAEIEKIILNNLQSMVYEPVLSGHLMTDQSVRRELIDTLAPRLRQARLSLSGMKGRVGELVKEYNRSQHLLTTDYTYHGLKDGGSDFSEITMIYQGMPIGVDLTINAVLSLNHSPDSMLGQNTIREYGGSMALQFNFDNPIAGITSDADMRPIALIFSGKYSHLKDIKDEIGTVQAKIDIPLIPGITLPIAFNYSTRTETSMGDEFRVTIGAGIDFDSIMASVKANRVAKTISELLN